MTAVRRSRLVPGDEISGVRFVQADVTRPETMRTLPVCTHVVYAVAAGEPSDAAYERAYRTGVANVVAMLRNWVDAPKRFLFVSSTGVYSQDDGSWVDETSPIIRGDDDSDDSSSGGGEAGSGGASRRWLIAGEQAVASSGLSHVIFRLAGIYGPERMRIRDMVQSGRATVDPSVLAYTNRIHRDDAALGIMHLLELDGAGGVFIGCDSEPIDRASLYVELAKRLGAPPPAGAQMIRGAGAQSVAINKRCSNEKLLATGFRFRFPTWREGYGV